MKIIVKPEESIKGGNSRFIRAIHSKSTMLSIAGAICLSGAAMFLEHTAAAGILSILGLLLLLCGGRCAQTRGEILRNGILLWYGHSLRFCTLFGTELIYVLLSSLIFLPYSIAVVASLFLDRFLHKTGHPFLSALVLPAAYGLFAFLLAVLNCGFISNMMGYILCIPQFSILLSVFGEYILTFVLLLILICLSALWTEPQTRMKLLFASVSLLLSAALLIGGTFLRGREQEPDYTLKIALATSQEMSFMGECETLYTDQQQLDLFESALQQAAEQGAKLLVLNEEYFYWDEEATETQLAKISEIVQRYGIPALIGIEVTCEEGLGINEAVYYDGDGQLLYTYVKNNLVPFIEAGAYENGPDEPALLQVSIDGHTLDMAFVICYDVNDEAYLRKIPSSTELLIVPSWDWDTANIEQRRTAIRAASLGLTMVKHTFEGFSFVSCPDGTCREEVDFRGLYEAVRVINVPIWDKEAQDEE